MPTPDDTNQGSGAAPSVVAPHPGNFAFLFRETVNPDGGPPRTLSFSNVQVRPCSYEQLAQARLHENVTIPLNMINGTLIGTDVEDVDPSAYVNVKAVLESPFTAHAIGLVRGGWLPSALAATRRDTVILPDRNIVTEIIGRFRDGRLSGRKPDFLDLFHEAPVRINPMLFALEGNGRAMPDPPLAEAQFAEAADKLRIALPKAELMIGPDSLTALVGMLDDMRASMGRHQSFLLEIAPGLVPAVRRRDKESRFDAILAAADHHGVPRGSLVTLAALSCVVTPNGATPAKRILKPSEAYSAADAYNAICDLRSLSILARLIGMIPDTMIQLCTADKNLALFWCGLGADDFASGAAAGEHTISLHPALMPAEDAQRYYDALQAA